MIWWSCLTGPGCATSHCCHSQSDTKPFRWASADVGAATDFWLDLRPLVAGLPVASLVGQLFEKKNVVVVASHVFAEELVLAAIFEREMGWNSSIYLNLSN